MTRTAPLLLVIDDDPAIRQTLSRELALAGYDTVGSGFMLFYDNWNCDTRCVGDVAAVVVAIRF